MTPVDVILQRLLHNVSALSLFLEFVTNVAPAASSLPGCE